MDRYDVANVFLGLSDPDRLKITKICYNHGSMSEEALRAKLEKDTISEELMLLTRIGILTKTEDGYVADKELLDTALNFMHGHCSGCKCGGHHEE